MPSLLDVSACHNLLRAFLAEDIRAGDITTRLTVSPTQQAQGEVIAKTTLVLAGIELFAEVFLILDPSAKVEFFLHDGEEIAAGTMPARVTASAHALLAGERVALNLLQQLSGVATLTRRFVRAIEGTGAAILDTRKTTPGLRDLEKYAVLMGGGKNHRTDLGQAVLIKDNHIRLAGGVSAALTAAMAARGQVAWIEIEVTNLEELRAALAHDPDVILLDNMESTLVRQAIKEVGLHSAPHKILTEASGGITLENVREFAETGVDWISVGALTHSAPAVDISFEIEPLS